MDLLGQVRAAFEKWQLRPQSGRILCAVSGGPDSMVMLDLLTRLRQSLDLDLTVATVDHGLRAAAAEEVALVADEALARNLPCHVLRLPSTPDSPAAARLLRYEQLYRAAIQHRAEALAVAHTASDQAETLLDRLVRGAGLSGLAAMRWVRPFAPGVSLIRPLLGVDRATVERHVAAEGLAVARDPTNLDLEYRRSRLRHEVLPLLKRERPEIELALAQLCDRLRADDQALGQWAQQVAARVIRQGNLIVDDLVSEPPAIITRVLKDFCPVPLGEAHLASLMRLIQSTAGSQSIDLPHGMVAERRYGQLRFLRPIADPGDVELEVTGPGHYRLLGQSVELDPPVWTAIRAPEGASLWLRNLRPGDHLLGRGSLKRLLIDRRVPRNERRWLPLLVRRDQVHEEVLWGPGLPSTLQAQPKLIQ